MDPHWSLRRHPVRNSELPRTAEVVVVGGGLVGTSVALALAESGRRPLIVEAEQLAARASGRNGGLLIPGGPESYLALRERWGKAAAQAVYALYDAGARGLTEWIDDYRIPCDWRAEGALRVAATGDEATALAAETVALVEDGFDAAWAPLSEMGRWLPGRAGGANGKGGGGVHGALVLPHGGAFHSGLLVTGLARHAVYRGAALVEEEPVLRIEEGPHGVEVVAKRGRISADAVVIATNVQVAELLPGLAGAVTPVRGQVLATAPLPSGTVRGAWSVNEGYEYLQQLPDGTVVAGGMRWTAADREMGLSEPEVNPDIQERIETWLAALLALEVVVERRWAGIMAFTEDRLPLVGRVPETERQYVAAAFNGHGVPSAHMAARMVRAYLNGEALPDGAHMVSPGRLRKP
jgi:glycine/D-amino acid oxidase-like deaminating enzyme